MAKDSSLYVRQAIVDRLTANPVAGRVGGRVYGPQRPAKPVWPFIACGVLTGGPFGASCLDGSRITGAVHAYAETGGEGDATVSGEAMAAGLVADVVAALDGETIDLQTVSDCPYPATAFFNWTGSNNVQDGAEADAWHAWGSFEIFVSS